MSDNNFVVIKTFHNLIDAKVAKSKLDAYEIPSWLDNENLSSLNWFYLHATGGVSLRVEQKDAKQAIEILDDTVEENSNKIPVKNKYRSRIVWMTIIAIILGIIFFSIF